MGNLKKRYISTFLRKEDKKEVEEEEGEEERKDKGVIMKSYKSWLQ